MTMLQDPRLAALRHAMNETLRLHPEIVCVDTETTGLSDSAEIIEIAAVGPRGETVFHSLVQPLLPIPASATAVHGITNEAVRGAPLWDEVFPQFVEAIGSESVIGFYNAQYDYRRIKENNVRHGLRWEFSDARVVDVMEVFAIYRGNFTGKRLQRMKLADAARACRIEPNGDYHRALADAWMTGEVYKYVLTHR